MSKFHIEPAFDMVLVVDVPEETSIDGIDLPDNVRQKDMTKGVVVSVGPEVSEHTKEKDIVSYGPYAGKFVVEGGTQFRLIHEKQIELYHRLVN